MQLAVVVLAAVVAVLGALAGLLIYLVLRSPRRGQSVEQAVAQFQETVRLQMEGMKGQMESGLRNVHHSVNTQVTLLSSVQQGLGKLEEAARGIQSVGKDLATLQDLLRPPKLRGGLGELMLERLLEQVVPQGYFAVQHRFSDGTAVDAAVFLDAERRRLVPIDSKFPLESFVRAWEAQDEKESQQLRRQFLRTARQHVDGVASYIRPAEGTLDLALMYVPAENVYYEMVVKREGEDGGLWEYCSTRRVIPVSPNTLYLYLHSITLGLRGLQLQERVHEVQGAINALTRDLGELLDKDFRVLGTHLKNAQDKYDETRKRLERFERSLTSAQQLPQASREAPAEPKLPEEGA